MLSSLCTLSLWMVHAADGSSPHESTCSLAGSNAPDETHDRSELLQKKVVIDNVQRLARRAGGLDQPWKSQNNSLSLQAWFHTHGLSEQVLHLRKPNSDDGDGSVKNPEWTYFATKCMQRRQEAVAREMLNRGCEHVVEVGGYLSPVDGFLRKLALQSGAKLPQTYTNIDPSVNKALDVTVGGMRSVHIPMTVVDFTAASAASFRHAFGLMDLENSTDNCCAVILSVWDPHVANKSDRIALRELLRHVTFLAASAASDEMEHLKVLEQIAKTAHALEPLQKSKAFNCSKALQNDTTHWPGDEVEYLDYLDNNANHMSKRTPSNYPFNPFNLLTVAW
mmetsp:Transcript_42476/g.79763  ORF Transcript_42476/g.79763 Transcript_42476/m.79763 type:complete len:336 (+) Transcript_42476:73-1080(+)